MAELKNDFSWSSSRVETYLRCPRQYWFHYYGSWGGWDRSADPRTRTLYVLKNLDTRQSWIGSTVHNCVRWVLDTLRTKGEAPSEEQTLALLGRRLNKDFTESGEGLYWENPKQHAGLLEHEYEEREIADEQWQAVMSKALACVSTFYASEVFRQLQAVPADQWLQLEDLASFELDGIKVWVQLDCAYREGDGVVIYDWKTGKADQHATREQLAGYILYAAQRWNVPVERVVAREFNLAHGTLHESRLDPDQLAAVRAAVAQSAAELRALHGAPEEQFPFTEVETRCARCNFTRLCPKFAGAADEG